MCCLGGGLLANLSHLLADPRNTDYLITGEAAKDKFYVTEQGLLYSSQALDREEKASYMVGVVAGRRGRPRGFRAQQPIQIKVDIFFFILPVCSNKFERPLNADHSPV